MTSPPSLALPDRLETPDPSAGFYVHRRTWPAYPVLPAGLPACSNLLGCHLGDGIVCFAARNASSCLVEDRYSAVDECCTGQVQRSSSGGFANIGRKRA